ncbi:hypothetical protein [Streptomyces sp. NPDC004376]
MTITPKPINSKSYRISERSPIGTRYTSGKSTFTLAAYSIDPSRPKTARPRFIDDSDLDDNTPNWFDNLTDGSIRLYHLEDILGFQDTLEVAPDAPELADRARTAAVKRYQDRPYVDTGEFTQVMLFDDLTTDEELTAFMEFAKAELRLREMQYEMERASRDRSECVARLVDLKGSQQAAAKTLGWNQSTVSRAARERP